MTQHKQSTRLTITTKDQIAFVCLNRPEKHNAIDMAMFNEIKKTINSLKSNRKVRAIIVSGAGESFCSGIDVSVLKSPVNALKLLFKWTPFHANLAQYVNVGWQKIPVPVIMAIHGNCWGGGLQIALGGDFRIATPDASLSILETRWGIIPDMGGSVALRHLVSLDVAKELAMTGDMITGLHANKIGLVSHIHDDPMSMAITLANKLSQQSPDTNAGVKKLYNNSWTGSKGMALAREAFYQIRILIGKNIKIKMFNQTHQPEERKTFVERKKW